MNHNIALALRALQKHDEVEGRGRKTNYFMDAVDLLGEELGLICTGVDDGGGFYSHNGDTCPIHEWLVDDDYNEVSDD